MTESSSGPILAADSLSPSVSIITITYKDAGGLQQTIASVGEQEYRGDLEQIVVDGDLASRSHQLCTLNSHSIVLIREPDEGRYDAMNKGIAASRYQYLWFMNSGDVFSSPRCVQVLIDCLTAADAPWGYGLVRIIGANGVATGIMGSPTFSMRRFAVGGSPVPHQGSLFRSDLVRSIGGYDVNHGLGADQLFIMAAAKLARPTVLVDFVSDFDGSGVGSLRSPRKHYREMSSARRKLRVEISGSRMFDLVISAALCNLEIFKRRIGRFLWE